VGHMLNTYDVTTSLVRERQHQMTRSAIAGRLARRARRARRQEPAEADRTYATIILPPPRTAEARHPAAA